MILKIIFQAGGCKNDREMKLGILRETKNPPDRRVPLTPAQCRQIMDEYRGTEIFIQPDGFRSFTDDEYRSAGITLKEDLSDCDVLLGVKEVATRCLTGR